MANTGACRCSAIRRAVSSGIFSPGVRCREGLAARVRDGGSRRQPWHCTPSPMDGGWCPTTAMAVPAGGGRFPRGRLIFSRSTTARLCTLKPLVSLHSDPGDLPIGQWRDSIHLVARRQEDPVPRRATGSRAGLRSGGRFVTRSRDRSANGGLPYQYVKREWHDSQKSE